jgi:hypothetical protein
MSPALLFLLCAVHPGRLASRSYIQLMSVIFNFESAYLHGVAWNGAWNTIADAFGAPASVHS